ncbi:MAG TPA: Hpt domain-containing protein [Anaerolineae bacterium]
MPEESAIDQTVFEELAASTGNDQVFLAELIDTYLADADELLAQMRGSLGAHDLEGFRRAAHSLKSNSANFGATGLASQARELELMARAGSLDGAAEKVAGVEDGFARVSAALRRLRPAA